MGKYCWNGRIFPFDVLSKRRTVTKSGYNSMSTFLSEGLLMIEDEPPCVMGNGTTERLMYGPPSCQPCNALQTKGGTS